MTLHSVRSTSPQPEVRSTTSQPEPPINKASTAQNQQWEDPAISQPVETQIPVLPKPVEKLSTTHFPCEKGPVTRY